MSLLFVAPNRNMAEWESHIRNIDPNIDIDMWPAIKDKEKVQFAVCWNHPNHLLDSFPNLKAVSSMGAGVHHLLADDSLSSSVDICRIVSPSLAQQMTEYVLGAVISIRRSFVRYLHQREEQLWQVHDQKPASELYIGVMGLGKIGAPVATQLAAMGYQVAGWSRSRKQLEGITCFHGRNNFSSFLQQTQMLICLLPLTDETKDILNLDLFKQLRQPSWLINVARGSHLVDEDLIYALDSDILQGAWLDVFSEEPLPTKHAFWNRPKITITPHIASATQAAKAAQQIVDNYKRALSGLELNNQIDRERGY